MKTFLLLTTLATIACSSSSGSMDSMMPGFLGAGSTCQLAVQTASIDPAQCVKSGKVPVYSNRFSSTCGSSGVISGAAAFSGPDASSTSSPSDAAPPGPPSAMAVSCGEPNCAAGEVAVVNGAVTADAGNVRCVQPPPACSNGSPQYVFSSSTWQCTGCDVVITYGAQYGNYSRCASAPTITCPSGQVPTWIFEAEKWECKNTCDNGQYDQHAVDGSTVCVPC